MTIRLQRRHLSSTPSGRRRASKLPHKQRDSRQAFVDCIDVRLLFALLKLRVIINFKMDSKFWNGMQAEILKTAISAGPEREAPDERGDVAGFRLKLKVLYRVREPGTASLRREKWFDSVAGPHT